MVLTREVKLKLQSKSRENQNEPHDAADTKADTSACHLFQWI